MGRIRRVMILLLPSDSYYYYNVHNFILDENGNHGIYVIIEYYPNEHGIAQSPSSARSQRVELSINIVCSTTRTFPINMSPGSTSDRSAATTFSQREKKT